MFPRTLLFFGLLSIVTACRTAEPPPDGAADAVASPTAPSVPAGAATPDDATVVVWTVADFAPATADGETLPFGRALDAYRLAYPETTIEVAVKPAYGPSGVLNHLRSTADVVPEQMPDITIVPISVVTDTVAAGIAQPLVDDELVDLAFDAFPFASVRVGDEHGTARAVPFAVDVLHAIARSDVPTQLTELSPDERLVVPIGADTMQANALLLAEYAQATGSLPLLPEVSDDALTEALAGIHAAVESGRLGFVTGNGTGRDAWNTFLDRDEGAAAVNGGFFVWQQGNFPALDWGQLPGANRSAPPIAWGWAYIVSSRDEASRARSEHLIHHLTSSPHLEWVLPAGFLPAWPDGWRTAVANGVEPEPDQEYLDFLVDQLIRAVSADSPERWAAGWSGALSAIDGGGTVQDAHQSIVPIRE